MENLPEHPYFMIADGTYCHILPDKIVLGQKNEIENMPEMDHNNKNKFTSLFVAFLLIVAGGFSFLFFTDRMVIEVYVGVLMIVIGGLYRLYLFRDTSDTLCIERKYITSTKIVKRFMGYTTWVIFFTTNKNEKLRRLVNVYDSKEYEARAEKLITEAGLL